ncbi:OsmC family protein [Umezakia ovalisporum]|uniref:OsmC family protein n=1 Tax=Umezakia ovalisporum FSS-43 TaxID=2740520 RepID=A0ABT6K5T1_9CYAN|nr:OsmC family protein [Umezakia ovalisporum]MDH6057684.1 OsmC family protein [Umezakia ovalisporum FSS-43]
MIERNATALWKGTGKEGTGQLTTSSTTLHETPYSFATRFENKSGTNPEELVAAAHAGCFAMKLSFDLNAAGYTADSLTATATVVLDPKQGAVTASRLVVTGVVPGLSEEEFVKIAEGAKANCPISKLLNAEITLEAGFAKKD